MKQIVAITLH